MENVELSLEKGTQQKNVLLQIQNSTIGSHMVINKATAILLNCKFIQRSVSNTQPLIQVTNSAIKIIKMNILKFQGGTLLKITEKTGQVCNFHFINCNSSWPLIVGSNQTVLSVVNSTFLSNDATIFNIENASVGMINNSVFADNKVSFSLSENVQSLVKAKVDSLLLFESSHFWNNTVSNGCVVYVSNQSVGIFQSSRFKDNEVKSDLGSVLAASHGIIRINWTEFSSNSGGAVSVVDSLNMKIENCFFVQNSATYGASICLKSQRNIPHVDHPQTYSIRAKIGDHNEIDSLTFFLHNHILPHELTQEMIIHNCTFVENVAVQGGAIYAENVSITTVRNTFTNNSAGLGIMNGTAVGGAVTLCRSRIKILECLFEGNNASFGGAVFADSEDIWMEPCVFIKNQAVKIRHASGGAVVVQSSNLGHNVTFMISKCLFEENRAVSSAGAILADIYHVFMEISESTFCDNVALYGGAISCFFANITNCTFESNAAEHRGGALDVGTRGIISHTKFIGNSAPSGGAVAADNNSTVSCSFCSFHSNTAIVR